MTAMSLIHSIYRYNKFIILLCVYSYCLCGCHTIPQSEIRASMFLRNKGYPEYIIQALVNMDKIESRYARDLSCESSNHVRFLIAGNKYIDKGILDKLISDKSDYVRSGAAQNVSINFEQSAKLMNDPAFSVISDLVINPSLTQKQLLDVYYSHNEYYRDLLLPTYARNENCPEKIKDIIRRSNNQSAIESLQIETN